MNLHIVLDPKEVAELKTLLDRALNTLPRQDWPVWVVELDEKLIKYTMSCEPVSKTNARPVGNSAGRQD